MTATLTVRIARKAIETDSICTLDLVPAQAGAHLPDFTAGAHIDVHLPNGLVRQYSLCNAPGQVDHYQLGVLQAPDSRGGSLAVHTLLKEQDTLAISVPRNHFPLAAGAGHHLLMAGGIGVTPLLAMAEALHRQGDDFTLHFSTRSRTQTPFLARMAMSPWGTKVRHHFDDEAGTALDLPAVLAGAPADTHLYVCGPKGYMEAVLGAARRAGWPEDRLHSEVFAGEGAPQAGDQAFEVELARSGKVIWVEADQTVARALDAAGVLLPTSCEQGICGTCLTRVVEGIPDHRDQYLTPEEQAANDQFLPCCSRAKSARLVLDL
ncbi:PDR/VanB family oxidoreductase [Ideonella livida]|uniref:Oxidoreductase n=1 Tax=Ideonella livida TaxID=2707176 RepID=A0A7C9PGG3_9BURK|nr:PDR/VanB family oxidoreductase [Ideonella livida]NDY91276.1 oxidoreductase [Ideonella livida]